MFSTGIHGRISTPNRRAELLGCRGIGPLGRIYPQPLQVGQGFHELPRISPRTWRHLSNLRGQFRYVDGLFVRLKWCAAQSARICFSVASFFQRVTSLWMRLAKLSAVPAAGSQPMVARRTLTSGCASALLVAALTRSIMAGGCLLAPAHRTRPRSWLERQGQPP